MARIVRCVIAGGVLLVAGVIWAPSAHAQPASPCIPPACTPESASPEPSDIPEPTPTPTPCRGLLCPRTPAPATPTATPRPTLTRVTLPPDTPEPTTSAARVTPTEEPTATPPPTATPTPTPVPSSPNRGLAVLGLFGSGGMIGSAAWIWRRYLS